MTVEDWDAFMARPAGDGPARAATIGIFDGLHLGHRALMERVLAKSPSHETCVFTFRENHKLRISRNPASGTLFSLAQKLEYLEAEGLDRVVLIDFSADFSRMAGTEFVSALRSRGVRAFVVGADFRCGHGLSMSAEGLSAFAASLGAETEIVAPLFHEGEAISSSRIRNVVAEARLEKAFAMLGRPYAVDVRGCPRESLAGEAAFDLSGSGAVLPPEGSYEGALLDGIRGEREAVREVVVHGGRRISAVEAGEFHGGYIAFYYRRQKKA